MLYAACAFALVAVQAAISLNWKLPNAVVIVNEVLAGAFTTVVTCAAFGEIAGTPARALIDRGFERSWAVILIGLGTDIFAYVGIMRLQSPGVIDVLLASALLMMTATLVFATVEATVGDHAWWALIPVALSHSITMAWRPAVFPRALIVLALGQIGSLWLLIALESALSSLHVGPAALLASGLSTAIVIPPVQTLATFVYLDATGFEAKHACGQ